ncbi:hypothetical protein Tco_1167403 [Tanacetum coccineum]
MPTEPTGHADSPSLDTELALTDSETESDEEVPVINTGDQDEGQAGPNIGEQDEGQAGPNPGIQDEGQAGSNPGDAAESQPQPSHGVHAGPNREHMNLEATDALSQQKPKQMDEEFTTTAYPNVQENLKLPTEDQFFVEKPHEEESGKTNAKTEVQSMVSVPIHQDTSSVPRMTTPGELEQHMADLIQNNLALEERDLPTVDMKKILQQRMFEDNSYKAHEEEARKKRRKRRDIPITPSRSPPSQPPPTPPPTSTSGALGTSGASGSSQLLPPPPPSSTGTSGSAQQQGSNALSLTKTAALASQSMAWTTFDTRYDSARVSGLKNYLLQTL